MFDVLKEDEIEQLRPFRFTTEENVIRIIYSIKDVSR